MKTLKNTAILAASLILLLSGAQNLHAQHKLTIVIDGIEQQKGNLFVGVYDESSFLKQHVYGTITNVNSTEITVELDSIKSGIYAVSVFHDDNGNDKLDTGAFGAPTEKVGFSNNAKMHYGPPKFSDCKFSIEEDMVIYITLK